MPDDEWEKMSPEERKEYVKKKRAARSGKDAADRLPDDVWDKMSLEKPAVLLGVATTIYTVYFPRLKISRAESFPLFQHSQNRLALALLL